LSQSAVDVHSLSKVFYDRKRGRIDAVAGVSFDAYPGEILGLLGPNGAGKTTTLRMLATILTPTGGSARIGDADLLARPDAVRRQLGFLSGDTGLYGRLTAAETIAYFGALNGLSDGLLTERCEHLKRELGMDTFWNGRCAKLSTGQRQKVNIARTVVHDPPVLILDEPTSGLDVLAARNIVHFIRSARDNGKCVLLSTHDMGEAERLADRIAIIHKGTIAATGTLSELRDRFHAANLEEVFLHAVDAGAE